MNKYWSSTGHPDFNHPGLGVSGDTLNPSNSEFLHSTANNTVNDSLVPLDDLGGIEPNVSNNVDNVSAMVSEDVAGDDTDDRDPGGTGAGAPIPREIRAEPGFLAAFRNRFNQLLLQDNPNFEDFESTLNDFLYK